MKPRQINFPYKTSRVELFQPMSGCFKAFLTFCWPWKSVFRSFFDLFWRFWMNFKAWYPTIQTLFPHKIAMTPRSSKVLSHYKIWGFDNGSKFADVSILFAVQTSQNTVFSPLRWSPGKNEWKIKKNFRTSKDKISVVLSFLYYKYTQKPFHHK